MVGDSLLSFIILHHLTEVSVIRGMAALPQWPRCQWIFSSCVWHLETSAERQPPSESSCRQRLNTCTAEHKPGSVQSQDGSLENRTNYPLPSLWLLRFVGMLKKSSCCFILFWGELTQTFISKKQRQGAATRRPSVPKTGVNILGSIVAATEYVYFLRETSLWTEFSTTLRGPRPPSHNLFFPSRSMSTPCFNILAFLF